MVGHIIISFLTLSRGHEESLGEINFRPRFLDVSYSGSFVLSSGGTRTRSEGSW